jgi:mannan endo-1,4-beta-mannosidase
MTRTTLLRGAFICAVLANIAACGSSTDGSATGSSAAQSVSPSSGGAGLPGTQISDFNVASPTGAMIPSATQLVDSARNVWTLSGAQVMENGKAAGYSANVALLLYYNGVVYQENKNCLWWVWSNGTWISSANPAPGYAPSCSSAAAAVTTTNAGDAGTAGALTPAEATDAPTARLLAYINGLPGQSRHILSGQHSSYWDSNPLDYVQAATNATGKTVAILGTTTGQVGSTENGAALSNTWLAKGGIPMVSWWPSNPFTGSYGPWYPTSSSNFAQLTQPGTAAYTAWYKLLDNQIAQLKQINGPVLYRPFVELNGSWSWWEQQNQTTFITVWQQMHDYFVSKGVTNVLWVYNVNTSVGNYTQYYPGSAYVDIVSWDSYPPVAGDPTYAALATLNKPIMIAETGVHSPNNSIVSLFAGDNSQLLATVKSSFPKVFAVVVFCQHWGLPEQNGEAAFMNDSAVLALSELPSGLVDP